MELLASGRKDLSYKTSWSRAYTLCQYVQLFLIFGSLKGPSLHHEIYLYVATFLNYSTILSIYTH